MIASYTVFNTDQYHNWKTDIDSILQTCLDSTSFICNPLRMCICISTMQFYRLCVSITTVKILNNSLIARIIPVACYRHATILLPLLTTVNCFTSLQYCYFKNIIEVKSYGIFIFWNFFHSS